MNLVVTKVLETAARVREFLRAHPLEGTSFTTAFARFEELLTRAQALVAQQREGTIAARAATAHRKELRRVLQFELLRHLMRVGVVAAKDRAEMAKQFQLPRGNRSHLAFLTAVKGMLAKAEALKDGLIGEGMSESLLDDLRAAAEEFEAASTASRTGRRDHVGARVELDRITGDITERIRLFDGLVRYRLRKDGELLGAWESASKVPGPSKAKVVPPKEEGGAVAPAA